MKTPSWWYRAPHSFSPISSILGPVACLYAKIAVAQRALTIPKSVSIPVICIGNLVAGGSGKTPTAISLLSLLKENRVFLSPAFLTRGYGGKIQGPERVDEGHEAIMWGDEALLLARHAPTYVCANRYLGGVLAQNQGADAVILDDGFQNPSLLKDISLVVIDGMMGFGNRKTIPAGPLREPLGEGLARADAFILIGEDTTGVQGILPADKPVFTAQLKPKTETGLPNKGPYIAFCGIGFPDKFRATLENSGIEIVAFHTYADHHPYTAADMTRLVEEALEKKARLLTTEKDFARLPDFPKKSLIDFLPVEITFDDPPTLLDFIKKKVSKAG
jgi:tetraacyldisaccharide 4'-kinase